MWESHLREKMGVGKWERDRGVEVGLPNGEEKYILFETPFCELTWGGEIYTLCSNMLSPRPMYSACSVESLHEARFSRAASFIITQDSRQQSWPT